MSRLIKHFSFNFFVTHFNERNTVIFNKICLHFSRFQFLQIIKDGFEFWLTSQVKIEIRVTAITPEAHRCDFLKKNFKRCKKINCQTLKFFAQFRIFFDILIPNLLISAKVYFINLCPNLVYFVKFRNILQKMTSFGRNCQIR